MTSNSIVEKSLGNSIRLWPGVLAVTLQWLARFVVPLVAPDAAGLGVIAAVAGGFGVVVWWLFFSRAPWLERVGVLALMAGGLLATAPLVHE
jgi:hypothetical protein